MGPNRLGPVVDGQRAVISNDGRSLSVDLHPELVFMPVVLGGALLVLVMALAWQRKGLTTQQRAMSQVDESLELSRRSIELQEEALALARDGLRCQREVLEVLRRLADREGARGIAPQTPAVESVRVPSGRLDG